MRLRLSQKSSLLRVGRLIDQGHVIVHHIIEIDVALLLYLLVVFLFCTLMVGEDIAKCVIPGRD